MSWLLGVILLISPNWVSSQEASPSCEETSEVLEGLWKFEEYIYDGNRLPRPNPKLHVYFEFYSTGTHRVWWTRDGENGFCERIGVYDFDGCTLEDRTEWVNPENNIECSKDPDMRVGNQTTTEAFLKADGDELHLTLGLGGEPFIYILHRDEQTSSE
jgi:hypothetical protein